MESIPLSAKFSTLLTTNKRKKEMKVKDREMKKWDKQRQERE
jgi:hypothetical protein